MSKRLWVYSLGIISAVILLAIIYLFYCRVEPAEIILTATAVIIYVYAYETYELRKATVDHTEIYTRPVLILDVEPDNRSQKVFLRLHNFGNSPAYNIEFRKTEFRIEKPESVQWSPKLQNIGVVPPEGEVELLLGGIDVESRYDRVDNAELFKFINSARIAGDIYSFMTTVLYDDILGHSWRSDLGYSSTTGIIATKPEVMKRETERKRNKGGEPK